MRASSKQPTSKEMLLMYNSSLVNIGKEIKNGCYYYILNLVIIWNRLLYA